MLCQQSVRVRTVNSHSARTIRRWPYRRDLSVERVEWYRLTLGSFFLRSSLLSSPVVPSRRHFRRSGSCQLFEYRCQDTFRYSVNPGMHVSKPTSTHCLLIVPLWYRYDRPGKTSEKWRQQGEWFVSWTIGSNVVARDSRNERPAFLYILDHEFCARSSTDGHLFYPAEDKQHCYSTNEGDSLVAISLSGDDAGVQLLRRNDL